MSDLQIVENSSAGGTLALVAKQAASVGFPGLSRKSVEAGPDMSALPLLQVEPPFHVLN